MNKKRKRINNNKKSTRSNKSYSLRDYLKLLLLTLPLIVPISIGYYGSKKEEEDILKYEAHTQGVVTKTYEIIKRGKYFHYNFRIDNKIYKGSQGLSRKSQLNVGDTIEIVYSYKNPENNKANIN
ncbi:hypothetical protein [Marinifilum fragile]|uniref:hypothetical protein n=1 Tax=Marinifilum fragile TaxID=570161 RepID=UPI002AAC0BB5|nr:hypothetical protein [Marinifilum fragile]